MVRHPRIRFETKLLGKALTVRVRGNGALIKSCYSLSYIPLCSLDVLVEVGATTK